jgi:hypothetical protein
MHPLTGMGSLWMTRFVGEPNFNCFDNGINNKIFFFLGLHAKSKRDISTINTLRIELSHHNIEIIPAQDKQL